MPISMQIPKKIYVHCGLEFRPELEGRIAILKKALHGLSPVEIDGMLTLPRPCII
jgi:hypothetical protein